jgi:hypothetical protein
MPRKKTSHIEPKKTLPDEFLEEETQEEETEEEYDRSGGLDLYDADGELIEEGSPTYLEEDSDEEYP